MLRSEPCGSAPAASDIEQFHTRFEGELVENEAQLVFLRHSQIPGAVPEGATVYHVRVEHSPEEIIAGVIMTFADGEGASRLLQVYECALEIFHGSGKGDQLLIDAAGENSEKQLFEIVALPPALHIGLSKAEVSLENRFSEHTAVKNPDVPGVSAVDGDVRSIEKVFESSLEMVVEHGAALRFPGKHFVSQKW